MINFFTKPMKLMTVVVNKTLSDKVAQGLLKLGVMDFINVKDLDIDIDLSKMQSGNSIEDLKEIDKFLNQIKSIYSQGGILPPKVKSIDIPENFDFRKDECRVFLYDISNQLAEIKERQKISSQKYHSYAEMNNYMVQGKVPYLDIRVGGFTKEESDLKNKIPSSCVFLYLNNENSTPSSPHILVSLKRDGGKINPVLDKLGWIESDDVTSQKESYDQVRTALGTYCDKLKEEHNKIKNETNEIVSKNSGQMDVFFREIQIYKLCMKIKSSFINTKNTSIFSGWVPTDKAKGIETIVMDDSKGQCIIEWTEAKEVRGVPIPVEMDTPGALAPFSRIVNNFNTPEYGSVNPVFLTTIAFMIMFALMFADVGQGFVLLLIGFFMGRSYKKNPMKKEGLISSNLCELLIYLGFASMAGGALFGSYFGFEVFPPLWFNFHGVVMGTANDSTSLINDVYDILGITIKFGFAVIVVGLILNWINLARKKDWVHLLLDKYGISGGTIFIIGYWGANVFVASGYKTFPSSPLFTYGIGIPVFALLLKAPFKAAINKTKVKIDIMDWFVDLLEIFSGYLSNTLSFMRVAGLGIAHVSLMAAFEQMSEMIPNLAGKILILLIGNALVIALEGLSAGIQALRLNYYEFFTKFFTGRGVAYKPVNLDY